jgi:eukaryotic-like serine/threonine-protein kinase
MVGQTVSHFRILEKIGSGGMGVVFKAEDTRLRREVALKFFSDSMLRDAVNLERFRREACSASALNHPNICTIYEFGDYEGQPFISMELLKGEVLSDRIAAGAIPFPNILRLALELADALDVAHAQRILHRDIKPSNVFITERGHAKLIDFGLAKPIALSHAATQETRSNLAAATLTSPGSTPGTFAYMSPEQLKGEDLDGRSDIFALGAVIYEAATGEPAFGGDTLLAVMDAVANRIPVPISRLNPAVPPEFSRVIFKCLEKDRGKRYPSTRELTQDLQAVSELMSPAKFDMRRLLRKPAFVVPAAIVIVIALSAAAWLYRGYARRQWAHSQIPQIQQLVTSGKPIEALSLLQRAQAIAPDDAALLSLATRVTWPGWMFDSDPPGADVSIRDYDEPDGRWWNIGKTPIDKLRLPHAHYVARFTKPGYDPAEVAAERLQLRVALAAAGTLPASMVQIPEGSVQVADAPAPVFIPSFLLDKYEVTNREFKAFVDAGGYRNPKFWKHPFTAHAKTLSLPQAMLRFRDTTDRPGPSTWQLGSFPPGQDDYPVSGVSWFEAAAYAEFAGKSLPTVFHWRRAATVGNFSDILQLSNFAGKGPDRVGANHGLGGFGTYDMAGNVKEWCLNGDPDRRYILGGSANEPLYMYMDPDARDPFDRSPLNGFRLAKYTQPISPKLAAPVHNIAETIDYRAAVPASDAAFKFYETLYSYDRTPLEEKIESEDSSPEWTMQRVTFNAAYGNERVPAYLFLPKSVQPPYQTVVYFPHGGAQVFHSVDGSQFEGIGFLVRAGRAVLFPMYKGSYERLGELPAAGTVADRDLTVQDSKDLRRAVDYIETRSDLDHNRIAYYSVSWGAMLGSVMVSLEQRFKAAVFVGGGCDPDRHQPEVDPINFAPRVTAPTLMINGRYDFELPLQTCQEPLFRLLGTSDKRHAIYETGHAIPELPKMKETLNWLDQHLGPVK